MSRALSVKLREDVLSEAERLAKRMKRPRNAYVNDAIAFYNKVLRRKELARLLHAESDLVRDESMAVLASFEALQDEIPE